MRLCQSWRLRKMAAKVPAAGVDLDGAVTVNESSADKDFRVESNGDANMLFVDGGQNLVRVGNNAHTNSLIAGNFDLVVGNESSGATGLAILSTNNENSYVSFFDQDNSGSFRGTVHYNHTNDYMQIYTNGTAGIRQHSNQVLSASAGVALGVGTANTASNVLDDYEEGTWTPAWATGFYAENGYLNREGFYTKVGRLVTCQFSFRTNTSGWTSNGNQMTISGVPFTMLDSEARAFGISSFHSFDPTAVAQIYGNNNSTVLQLYKDGDESFTQGSNHTAASGKYFIGGFSFITA